MTYSLTVAGYTFDNPPERYRKQITVGNNPIPHYQRTLASFYQSDQQEIQFEVEGRLSLNEQSDLDELSRLQELSIEGGEVRVDFDPFFSGKCIIEDDPIRQEADRGNYRFIMTVNTDETDPTAYPSHATPTTGNTFELGSFNLGYDPDSVQQNYERQTDTVDRLQGISQSQDTAGLVTRVELEGSIDGAGQASLWQRARDNVLAYLNAEFQNGWALISDLSVTNNQDAPDYLKGLFDYNLEVFVVSDPGGGIGQVTEFIDHDVKDTGTYTSDSDSGSIETDGLDVEINAGTGALNDGYVSWPETEVTLSANDTNYVYVTDANSDGEGVVEVNQSAFPADVIPLWEFVTDGTSITSQTDHRDLLVGENDTTNSDLVFSDRFVIDDTAFSWADVLAFTESLSVADGVFDADGVASLTESVPLSESIGLPATGKANLTEMLTVGDGGSATDSGTPELQTNTTLNGQTAEATVFEDTSGDGNADNQQTVVLPDGVSTTALTSLSGGSSNDYWIRFDLSTGDTSTSPEVHTATVNVSGGGDADQNPSTSWEIDGAKHDRGGNEYEGGGVVSKYGS